jgi:hypothetical protein
LPKDARAGEERDRARAKNIERGDGDRHAQAESERGPIARALGVDASGRGVDDRREHEHRAERVLEFVFGRRELAVGAQFSMRSKPFTSSFVSPKLSVSVSCPVAVS